MEYKIDKIDVEVRQRVNEISSKNRVHGQKEIKKFEFNIEDEEQKENKKHSMKKKDSQKKIKIEAQKFNEKSIKVEAVKDDNIIVEKEKGCFIDVRK